MIATHLRGFEIRSTFFINLFCYLFIFSAFIWSLGIGSRKESGTSGKVRVSWLSSDYGNRSLSLKHVYLFFQLIRAYSHHVNDVVDRVVDIIDPFVGVIQWHLLGYVDPMYHVINLCSAASVWLWHGFGEIWYRSNYPKEWVTFSNKMFRSST